MVSPKFTWLHYTPTKTKRHTDDSSSHYTALDRDPLPRSPDRDATAGRLEPGLRATVQSEPSRRRVLVRLGPIVSRRGAYR